MTDVQTLEYTNLPENNFIESGTPAAEEGGQFQSTAEPNLQLERILKLEQEKTQLESKIEYKQPESGKSLSKMIGDFNKPAVLPGVYKSFNEKEINEEDESEVEVKEKFHWKPALVQSGVFLGIQHGFRMTQEKTTKELRGPFFSDWARSIRKLRGWEDGDSFFTNYIAHPAQGGVTGRIFINNSDSAKKQEFGKSKKYWESRFKAMAWSAVWSTQFELGPVSEASLGNVGLKQKNGHSTMAWADLIVTPVVGTAVVIAEDAVDKYFLKNWVEKKTKNKFLIKLSRSLFTPTTSFTNLLRGRMPWRRGNRLL
jgi:hypothetical protein